jgi:PPOX class probable F420-dependent enzyme
VWLKFTFADRNGVSAEIDTGNYESLVTVVKQEPVQEAFMSKEIPTNFRDLFEKRAFCQLATQMKDGTPQVTPVWCDFDGTHVILNSAKGRVKDKNMRRNPNVALSLQDPDNPYRYLGLKGKVVEITETGADAHIDKLAKKYLGKDKYPNSGSGEVRVKYKVRPDRVWTKE